MKRLIVVDFGASLTGKSELRLSLVEDHRHWEWLSTYHRCAIQSSRCVFVPLAVCLWLSLGHHQRSRSRRHGRVVLHHGDQHQLQHVSSRATCLLCSCRSCCCGVGSSCLSVWWCHGNVAPYVRTIKQNFMHGHTQDHLSINSVATKQGKSDKRRWRW